MRTALLCSQLAGHCWKLQGFAGGVGNTEVRKPSSSLCVNFDVNFWEFSHVLTINYHHSMIHCSLSIDRVCDICPYHTSGYFFVHYMWSCWNEHEWASWSVSRLVSRAILIFAGEKNIVWWLLPRFRVTIGELGQDLGQANQIAEQSLKNIYFNGSLRP